MTIDKVIVSIFSLGGIVFTWWFFLRRPEKQVVASNGEVDIVVEGGYNPETITIPKGKTTVLNFLRKDSGSCLEEIVIADFKVRKQLALGQKTPVSITPQNEGEYPFSCGMNMFHGKIRVV